jgi:hypothetical protein
MLNDPKTTEQRGDFVDMGAIVKGTLGARRAQGGGVEFRIFLEREANIVLASARLGR